MGARFSFDPIFGRKYFLDIKIKGQSDPRKDAIFYGDSDVRVSFFPSVYTYSGGSRYASDHELYGHAAAAYNSIADQVWSVFFLMRTRLGIPIVGGGGGVGVRVCVTALLCIPKLCIRHWQ